MKLIHTQRLESTKTKQEIFTLHVSQLVFHTR